MITIKQEIEDIIAIRKVNELAFGQPQEANIIDQLRAECPFVIVLGHLEYYPHFGFEQTSHYGLRSVWEVPDEAFMILVLDASKMRNVSGTAKYQSEFDEAM